MLHRWFSKRSPARLENVLPHSGASAHHIHNQVHFGCSWCPHPVGQAYILLDVSDSTLPTSTHGFIVKDDINP